MKITKSEVDALPYTTSGQKLYFDRELKGFGLLVSRNAKSYVAQKDILGKTKRINIGRHGTWTTEEARKQARLLLAQMDKGENPSALKIEETRITFSEAYYTHIELLKRRESALGTLDGYELCKRSYLKEWLNRPLHEISRSEARELHSSIGEKHGHCAANRAMRYFRAIYNTALKEHEYLTICPTIAVHWFKERRRQEPIPVDNLPTWWQSVMAIRNAVRKDYQIFVLFTGIRRTDSATIRLEDINLANGSLFRPKPKGGEKRAFTVPLPDICIEIINRRIAQNRILFGDDCPWLFPTFSRDGNLIPIQEPKEQRKGMPSPHRLRDTYTTAANAAGLSPYDIDVLTNHRPPKGSVTAGYIRQDFEYLRLQQQKVADYLKAKLSILGPYVAPTAENSPTHNNGSVAC